MKLKPAQRKKLTEAGIVAVCAVALVVIVAVLLWLDGVWPEKLIPWLPFERA